MISTNFENREYIFLKNWVIFPWEKQGFLVKLPVLPSSRVLTNPNKNPVFLYGNK